MAASAQSFRIDVDVRRALEVLSGSVFTGRDQTIRELIANAADSIAALPPQSQSSLEIRLIPVVTRGSESPGTLSVADTGIGMTFIEAKERLGKLFASSKGGVNGAIGCFGIGFYSCLPLCSQVEVLTRTRAADDLGTRILYSGGERMEIQQWEVERPGTTVVLHLLQEHRKLLDQEVLIGIVRRYCNFIQYPIYAGYGSELLNVMDAPWYHESVRDEQVGEALSALFAVRETLALFPFCDELPLSGRVEGAFYVLPVGERPSLRIYSQRVMITESDKSLLTEELHAFVAGVLDVSRLPLVISRDGIVENTAQLGELRAWIIRKISESLHQFANRRSKDFRRLMATHGPAIKAACVENRTLLDHLRNLLPFRSSMRQAITVPEYLSQRSDRRVIYCDDEGAGAALIPLYNQSNIEVLYMTDAVDRFLRENWTTPDGLIEFHRLDEDPPKGRTTRSLEEHHEKVRAADVAGLRLLFQSQVDGRLRAELRSLSSEGPSAILSVEEEARQQIEFVETVRRYQKEGRLGELPIEVQKMVRDGFLDVFDIIPSQTIILNEDNEIVKALLIQLRPDSRMQSKSVLGRSLWRNLLRLASNARGGANDLDFAPDIARFLYSQALLSSGLYLSSEKLTEISQSQTVLISGLLKALRVESSNH